MIQQRLASFQQTMTRHWRWGLPAAVAIVVVDQLSKSWVLATPVFRALDCLDQTIRCGRIEIGPVFDFSMLWNRGVSFGALQAEGLARWGLFTLTGVIALVFIAWLLRVERWRTALALTLVVGGAVGNMIDRARFGAVVDFIDFSGPWFGWRLGDLPVGFPWVFNAADAAITVGAILLLLDQVLATSRKDS
jgi:signal peptidase II